MSRMDFVPELAEGAGGDTEKRARDEEPWRGWREGKPALGAF